MSTRLVPLSVTASAAAAALALILVGCSSPSSAPGGEAPAVEAPAAEAPTAEEPAAEEPAVPGLNTPVVSGTFEFTALGVTDLGTTIGTEPLSTTAQGTFLQVDLKVANIGAEGEMFLVNYVKLVDAEGRTFDADSMAAVYLDSSAGTWVASINPGNAVQGPVIFDVPAGTQAASIQVTDSLFSTGETIALR